MKKQILIVALLLLMAGLSCQTPTQPNPVTIPVTRTVYVYNEIGKGIPQASVQLFPKDSIPLNSDIGTTDSYGKTKISRAVPTGYQKYTCMVNATGYTSILDTSLSLGCGDTALEFILPDTLVLQCGSTGQKNDTVQGCVDSVNSIPDVTLSITCPSVTVTHTTTGGNMWNVSFYESSNGSQTPLPANGTWQLTNGEEIIVKLTYKPTVVSNGDRFTLTLTATGSSTTTFNYSAFGTAADCSTCACPPNPYTVQVGTLAMPDSACVNDSISTFFDLSKILNDGTCDWSFQIVNNFPDNSAIRVPSFFSIPAGTSGPRLPVTFAPLQNKLYNEMATYSVSKVKNGVTTAPPCSETLTLHFFGQGTTGSCSIDQANSTLLQSNNNTNFSTCINQTQQETLVVKSGACPVLGVSATISGANANYWFVTPNTPVDIAPNSSQTFVVTFSPTSALAFNNGVTACNYTPQALSATLTLNGCANSVYPLQGIANSCDKPFNDFSIPDTSSSREGVIIVDSSNEITSTSNDSNWTMFVSQVMPNAPTPSAMLYAWSPGPNLYRAFFYKEETLQSNVTLCPPTGKAAAHCSDCGTPKVNATQLSINVGDVILFSFFQYGGSLGQLETHCGIMYVESITSDKDGHPYVLFDYCYPIQ